MKIDLGPEQQPQEMGPPSRQTPDGVIFEAEEVGAFAKGGDRYHEVEQLRRAHEAGTSSTAPPTQMPPVQTQMEPLPTQMPSRPTQMEPTPFVVERNPTSGYDPRPLASQRPQEPSRPPTPPSRPPGWTRAPEPASPPPQSSPEPSQEPEGFASPEEIHYTPARGPQPEPSLSDVPRKGESEMSIDLSAPDFEGLNTVINPPVRELINRPSIARWDNLVKRSALAVQAQGHALGVTTGSDVTTSVILNATRQNFAKVFLISLKKSIENSGNHRLAQYVGHPFDLINEFVNGYRAQGGRGISFLYIGMEGSELTRVFLEAIDDAQILPAGAVVVFDRFWGFSGWEGGSYAGLEQFSQSRSRPYVWIAKGRDNRASIMIRD